MVEWIAFIGAINANFTMLYKKNKKNSELLFNSKNNEIMKYLLEHNFDTQKQVDQLLAIKQL